MQAGQAGLKLDHLKEGDRRTVTVLFSDLAGFTSLAENMDPEEADVLMSRIFEDFEGIIRRHDGTVEKYIGDALVAVFGAPRIHEDDPARAVHAALDFSHRISQLNKSLGVGELRFRTGIHTGLITTGTRGDHTVVTGHTMNLASRLQSAAEPGTILISDQTVEECGSEFSLGAPIEVSAKGIHGRVRAFPVLGRSPHSLKPDNSFTGREDLLQEILTAYLRFDGKAPGGIVLTGEAGIGKSALAKKFLDLARHYPNFDAPVLHARARKFHTRPFAVVADCFLNLIHLTADSSAQAIRSRLEDQFGLAPETANGFLTLLDSRKTDTAPGQYLALLTELTSRVFLSKSKSPYLPILFLDNGEFIDSQSLDFLKFYAQKTKLFPFLILTDREPRENLLEIAPGIPVHELPPLDGASSSKLLAKLLNGHDLRLSADEEEQVLTNASGNPLFIHSYSRWLIDRKQQELQEQPGSEGAAGSSGEIPVGIQNVYLAELSTYNEDVRDLLKKLSVFNHSFSLEDAVWLQEQTNADPAIVRRCLEFFLQQDIIAQDQHIYFFRHDVQKNALYSSLLNYNKRILHRLIAQRMRLQSKPHPVRLIHHLVRSEAHAEALEVFSQAQDRSINLKYLPYLEVLAQRIPPEDSEDRLTVQFSRCAILFNNGLVREAEKIIQDILQTSIRQTRPDYAARAYHLLAAYNTKSYRFQKAYFCGMKALDMYSRIDRPKKPIINLLLILIQAEAMQNHRERAEKLLAQARAWGKEHGAETEVALAEVEFAYHTKDYRAAWELYDRLSGTDSQPEAEFGFRWHWFGYLLAWERFDLDALVTDGAALLETPLLDPSSRSQACAHLALACSVVGRGDPDNYLNQAAFYALRSQNSFDRLEAEAVRASVLLALGRGGEAEAISLEHLPMALRHSAFPTAFRFLMVLAESAAARTDHAGLAHLLLEAGHIFRMGVALDDLEIISYLYLSAKHAATLPPPQDPGVQNLTSEFFASGDSRTLDQPQDLAALFERVLGYLADDRARERFLRLRLMGEAHQYAVGAV